MKKLLTFAAAVLASMAMMAQTTLVKWGAEANRVGQFTCNNAKVTFSTVKIHNNADEVPAVKFESTYKYTETEKISLTVKPTTGGFLAGDVVTMALCFSNSSDSKVAKLAIYAADGTTQLYLSPAAVNGRTSADDPEVLTYTLLADQDSLFIGRFDAGTTTFLTTLEIERPATCEDPEFTVPEGGTGFVGDPITLAITSKNQSKPVKYALTLDGVEAVSGTDYSFSVSTGQVQAIPLKAGTFVITFTQASNGTYCDAEATSTFVISEKTPVTSFTVEGPTEARVGDEITLTATNFNANPTRVWWVDQETGETIHEGATYTFKADAEGEVWYFVLARNDFNNPNEEEDDYAYGMYGYVNVTMGHNAYLSDLKVNGVTIEGFDDEVFEYDLGEIGVYEPVEVTATAADEPYATATINPGDNNVLVTVFAQDKTTYESYVITYTRKAATELAPISESTTWDFTKTGATTIQLSETTLPTKTQEFVYADLLTNPDESFNAAALAGIQEYVVRDGKLAQGSQLRFVTTVPGTLEVVYSNTGNRTDEGDRRFLVVNGGKIGEGSMKSNETVTESNIAVAAGEVALTGLLNKDESAQYLRFYKIVFTKSEETAIDNAAVDTKAVKVIRDGQVIILRDGKTYNALGTEVR